MNIDRQSVLVWIWDHASASDLAALLSAISARGARVARCYQCQRFTTDYHEDVESYKNYTETVCGKCVKFCFCCAEFYTRDAEYKHDECSVYCTDDECNCLQQDAQKKDNVDDDDDDDEQAEEEEGVQAR